MSRSSQDWQAIDKFAKRLGASAAARAKWRQRGIPHRYRLALLRMAEEAGLAWTEADLQLGAHADNKPMAAEAGALSTETSVGVPATGAGAATGPVVAPAASVESVTHRSENLPGAMPGNGEDKNVTDLFEKSSFLYAGNSGFIEDLYARFLHGDKTIDPSWQQIFAALGDEIAVLERERRGPSWATEDGMGGLQALQDAGVLGAQGLATRAAERAAGVGFGDVRLAALDTIRAAMMIRAYRIRGHLIANLDPLGLEKRKFHPELDPATYGFREGDMDRPIFIDYMLGLETATVREILQILRRTYCGTIGVEYMHISYPAEKSWIQERIEGREKEISFTPEGKKAILRKLIEAEGFEHFCGVKFPGTKRFGLDGAEPLIPALEAIIKRGGQLGVTEIVLGMSHRGRLNVLANVMGKPYQAIFSEFEGGAQHPDDFQGSGDVKYHLGTSSDREFDGNRVHLSLAANPSHLEAVDPVVLGRARAKQAQLGPDLEQARGKVLTVLLHGDAAFAGQGIVAECFALSELKGYRTGGTIHFIINNQIGFTTSPGYARSSPYPSDVAKVVQAPIFHVNGDDPEAVVHVAKVATEYRQMFRRDVVIDMFCFRRFGHNEADEPAFTQPLMYQAIGAKPKAHEIYGKRLIEEGLVTERDIAAMREEFRDRLEREAVAAGSFKPNKADWFEGRWTGFEPASGDERRGSTAVAAETLKDIGTRICAAPRGFNLHRTLARVLAARRLTVEQGDNIDWATAEALAFGTLCLEGCAVRLSGQDSGRGTFSQRHAVFIDQDTEARYMPLNNLHPEQASFEVHDSLLSELAVLGFEYGFSQTEPNALVLWEAQFGDFANGAQVVIDTFLAAAESKWMRMSGLVLLLPHGFEGQGPEHSSARLERHLQLCAEDNLQVVNPTTPAQYFHVLRRQIHRKFRKPLVVLTPKSLLRHKLAVSRLADMAPPSSFHRVMPDGGQPLPDAEIKRVVICSGKVYYDLLEAREKAKRFDAYLLRVEQLYPFPHKTMAKELARFPQAEAVIWCQEEPKNMGAWTFVAPLLENVLRDAKSKVARPRYAGRKEAASPATGLYAKHLAEQAALVKAALED
jgi:2-oxoglutarate dehydrogenase E1 component